MSTVPAVPKLSKVLKGFRPPHKARKRSGEGTQRPPGIKAKKEEK